jgi:hypothetical protein
MSGQVSAEITSAHSRLKPDTMHNLALAAWIVSMFLLVSGAVLFCLGRGSALDITSDLTLIFAFACFGTVGMLITVQRPHNTVGWLFCAVGIGTGITTLSAAYTHYGSSLPGINFFNELGNVFWPINLILLLVFLPLLFPDGRLLTRRWRIVVWLTVTLLLLNEFTSLLATLPSARLAILGQVVKSDFWDTVNQDMQFVLLPLILLALVAVIRRFIRSKGPERQQMKWLTYGSAVAIGLVVVSFWVNDPTNFLFAGAIICLPVSIGISILRYRLYDIDRLISRTLMYVLLTALLALTYLALVFGLQFILQGVTQNSPVPIVVSTLAIAGLFQPLRRIIQNLIDRSFYRRRYDAEQVLAGFGSTLRNELYVGQLRERLLEVVQETMQPTQIALWIRSPSPREKPEM